MTDIYQMALVKKYSKKNVFALLPKKALTDENKSLVFKYYLRLGVNVIFAENYGELPKALRSLFI